MHQDPVSILARASAIAPFATPRARREGLVDWHRAFDAATLGTIQAMDKANSASFMHDRPEHTHRNYIAALKRLVSILSRLPRFSRGPLEPLCTWGRTSDDSQ